MANLRAYHKPLNELESSEIEKIFTYIKCIPKEFLDKYGKYSIAEFPIEPAELWKEINSKEEYNMERNYLYLLAYISSMKYNLPKNSIIALFGAPGCGKSHLIRLVYKLKGKTVEEIKTMIKDANVDDETAYKIKELVDSFTIVQKKTTRQPRKNEQTEQVEILAGVSLEEVQACEFTYTYADNLYGISKKDIDSALLDGHVIMIVNDDKVQASLKATYGEQMIKAFVYRDSDKDTWIETMLEGGRSQEEIQKRMPSWDNSMKMYYHGKSGFSSAIINQKEGSTDVNFLLQLKGILSSGRNSLVK